LSLSAPVRAVTPGILPPLARSVLGVVRDQELSFLAAAIAYYAFVSVVPLFLLAFAVATAVAGQAFADQVVAFLGAFLTPEASTLLEAALVDSTGRGGVTVLGLVVLLWSSLRLFRGLDVAFARVYGSDGPVSLLSQVRDALLVLAAAGVTLGVAVLGTALALARVPGVELFGPLVAGLCLAAVLFPLYYVFPDCPVGAREALPGTLLAAGGWTGLGTVFGFYAERAVSFQVYGAVGGILLALTWFYVGGLVVLLGGALNAALAGRGDRQLQQEGPRGATRPMTEPEGTPEDGVATVEPEAVDYEDLAELRSELERFEEEIEDRTVHRDELETELKQYVRRRTRRGRARGWGPYLVLLYGTAMTLGAFYFLSGVWAVLAMVVVWLSTLGLYALMVVVGATVAAAGMPGRVLGRLRDFRS
jgi:YihY family inner membrane protein